MDSRAAKAFSFATEQIHDEVTEIYEHIMDEENKEASIKIDAVVAKLRHLKSNLLIKDD